jgi:L-asparagine transporter-like permease
MKQGLALRIPRSTQWFALSCLALQLTGCELAKGIFKAGFWFGIIAVLALVALIGFGVSKLGS